MRFEQVFDRRRHDKYEYSVVVRTYNESMMLGAFLDSIEPLIKNDIFEFIFIDSGSTDSTCDIIESCRLHDLLLLRVEKSDFDFGLTCDLGIDQSLSDFVYFFSAHVYFLPNSKRLSSAIDKMKVKTKISGIYFRQVPNRLTGCDFIEQAFLARGFPETSGCIQSRNKLVRFSNAGSLIRRHAWLKNKFGKKLASEDTIWASRETSIGNTIVYDPEIIIAHSHNLAPKQLRARLDINYTQLLVDGFKIDPPLRTFVKYFFGSMWINRRLTFSHYQSCVEAFRASKAALTGLRSRK